jgi:hypothetical protein
MAAGEIRDRAMVWARGRPVQAQWPARHVVARQGEVSWKFGCFPTRPGRAAPPRITWVVLLSRHNAESVLRLNPPRGKAAMFDCPVSPLSGRRSVKRTFGQLGPGDSFARHPGRWPERRKIPKAAIRSTSAERHYWLITDPQLSNAD